METILQTRLSTGSCSHSYTNATTSKLPSLQKPKSEGLKGAMTRQVAAISCSCCILILHSTHFPLWLQMLVMCAFILMANILLFQLSQRGPVRRCGGAWMWLKDLEFPVLVLSCLHSLGMVSYLKARCPWLIPNCEHSRKSCHNGEWVN